MNNLFVLMVFVAGFQSAILEVRDPQYISSKFHTIDVYLQKSLAQIEKTQVGQKEVLKAAVDFAKTVKESARFLKQAVKDNTLNNEHGKELYEVANHGKDVAEWLEKYLNEPEDLKSVFKQGVEKYLGLVKEVTGVFGHLKNSVENYERAMNNLQEFIDNSVYLTKKLTYHLDFQNYTNVELRQNIHDVVNGDLAALATITEGKNHFSELVAHAHQLNYLVNNVIKRLDCWVKNSQSKNVVLKTNVDKAITELLVVSGGINRHATPTNTLENVKGMFKIWLIGSVHAVRNLAAISKGETDDIIRAALFDGVGIAMNFKSVFGYLTE